MGITMGSLWLAPAALAANEDDIKDVITPHVSPYDERDYRVLELENGLNVLLVSDPEADKAAASMNVRVGSAQDPDDLQGLAHFLEHMLFWAPRLIPRQTPTRAICHVTQARITRSLHPTTPTTFSILSLQPWKVHLIGSAPFCLPAVQRRPA